MTFNSSNTPQAPYTANSGISSTGQFQTVFMERDPTTNDVNYPVGKYWANYIKRDLWILQSFTTINSVTTANWELYSAESSTTSTLTGNSGGAVGVDSDNNINVVGDGTTINIVGNPATNTLTAGTTGVIASTYFTDSGSAVPSGGMLNIDGGTGINTSGASDTVTVNLTVPVTVPHGGTGIVTGTTAYAPICTGTTATGAFQVASTGISNSGYVLTSNGSSSLPSFQESANQSFETNIQVFTYTGSSQTYTPTSGMKYCIIECVGGGGGGGGALTTTNSYDSVGGGGGGGGYARVNASASSIGASQTVNVGAGGAGGIGGNNGTSGGNTTVGSLITGGGGTGGVYASQINGPQVIASSAGGSGTGTFAVTGGTGIQGITVSAVNGSRGGSGGESFFGGGGAGGALGGGIGTSGGSAGTGYGDGGGGALVYISGATGSANGGAGSNGVVIITEYIFV